MELQQAVRSSAHLLVIFPQLEDLQLAQRVVKVGRIGRAALGFHLSRASRLHTFLHEKIHCLVERHRARVHLLASDNAV